MDSCKLRAEGGGAKKLPRMVEVAIGLEYFMLVNIPYMEHSGYVEY